MEELRRKYSCRIQEQEEQIETLLVKINNLEKQKSRLQSEVEVLIIDLEKVKFDSCTLYFFFWWFGLTLEGSTELAHLLMIHWGSTTPQSCTVAQCFLFVV